MIINADARAIPLADRSVQCVVTSPPYWGLRDYGNADRGIGMEATLAEFLESMVAVFSEVRRVLRDDGVVWLNMGDSYAATRPGARDNGRWPKQNRNDHRPPIDRRFLGAPIKAKDLIGQPWRLAFALQEDGWYLRSDIVWHKPNPMPESVRDRPTKSHEYVFLLSKCPSYYYDAEAIAEECSPNTHARVAQDVEAQVGSMRAHAGQKTNGSMKAFGGGYGVGPKAVEHGQGVKQNFAEAVALQVGRRNKRTVWEIGTEAFRDAHFATFPTALVDPCIRAGTSEAGRCCECGAPRRRMLDRSSGESWHDHADDHQRGQRQPTSGPKVVRVNGSPYRSGWHPPVTVGWEPSCRCEAETAPCLVLDPFAGSGTTGVVARRLDRDFVGLELNSDYCAMARERIRREGRLTEAKPMKLPPGVYQDTLI